MKLLITNYSVLDDIVVFKICIDQYKHLIDCSKKIYPQCDWFWYGDYQIKATIHKSIKEIQFKIENMP